MTDNSSKPNDAMDQLLRLVGDELLHSSGEDLDEFVRDWGIDPNSAQSIVESAFKKALQVNNKQRLLDAKRMQELEIAKLQNFLDEISGSREDLLARLGAALASVRATNPEGATLEHRNLDEYSEEDLSSLLAQLSALK